MRRPLLLPAVLLLAGCQSETRSLEDADPREAAARGGWKVEGNVVTRDPDAPARPGGEGGDAFFDDPERDPADVVQVPLEAYAPLDSFFDNEGYLLGDRVEIDCSFEPFLGRLVGLAYADDSGKYVVREERKIPGGHEVRIWNATPGATTVAALLPRATFGSLKGIRTEDPRTGNPGIARLRPFFEVVGTREIVIRFHGNTSADCPVYFRARAAGMAPAEDPAHPKDCVYMNANRRRRATGPALDLAVEIRRDGAGGWTTVITDPSGRVRGTGGR